MTDGKQGAWATMLSAGNNSTGDSSEDSNVSDDLNETTPPPHQSPASTAIASATTATLTGSDLVKGGETPVLLACDSLGRVGLLRYPAQLPPPELALAAAPPAAAPDASTAEGAAVEDGASTGPTAGDAPSPEETAAAEAAAAAAADTMAQAIEAAVPRVRLRSFDLRRSVDFGRH